MDKKNTYLNGPAEGDVVIKQPKGFIVLDENVKLFVCNMKSSLHGLKQYGRNWFMTWKAF